MTNQPVLKPNRRRTIVLLSLIGAAALLAIIVAIALIAASFVRAGSETEQGEVASGVVFAAPAGDYEVTFPEKPQTQTLPQTAGEYELELNIATWESDDEYFAVNSTTYPPEVMEQDIDEILTNSVAGMVTSTPNGTLIESEFTELDGARAITGSIDVGETGTMFFTLSVYSNSQYTLLSLGHDRDVHDAFAASFGYTS